MTDQYTANGEFYDVFAAGAWAAQGPALAAALSGAGGTGDPIVDIGAGTGLGTAVIAATVADVPIVAVEPSASLRGGLFTRVMSVPGLADRVTVLPTDLAGANLPDRLGGAVAMNMLGHLTPDGRRDLWRLLATRLAPGAPVVIGLVPPDRVAAVPDTLFTKTQVGNRRYEGWGAADPSGPETVCWRMRWLVYDGDTLVDERHGEYQWYPADATGIAAELNEAGLTAAPSGDAMVVAHQPR